MNVIVRSGPRYSLNRLSMSSSVISANGLSKAAPAAARSFSTLSMMWVNTALSSPRGLLDPEPDEAERGALVEDHHQDHPLGHDGDVDVVALALVEEDRELLLADQAGQPVGGGHVAGGERGEGGGVEVLDLALRGDLLAVLVDEEDDLGVGVDAELRDDLLDLVELLLVHHNVGRRHSVILLCGEARPGRSGREKGGRAPRERIRVARKPLVFKRVSPECEFVPERTPAAAAGAQYSRRPSSALDMVTSSAHSRSEPTGTPMAMRVTRTPRGLRSRAR